MTPTNKLIEKVLQLDNHQGDRRVELALSCAAPKLARALKLAIEEFSDKHNPFDRARIGNVMQQINSILAEEGE